MYVYEPALEVAAPNVFMVWLRAWPCAARKEQKKGQLTKLEYVFIAGETLSLIYSYLSIFFSAVAQQSKAGQGHLILEVCRSHMLTDTHHSV